MDFLRRIFHIGVVHEKQPLRFFNTLTKSFQDFSLPSGASAVRMYNCGPTVYDRQHIGNLSAAVFADTIRRVLEFNGYSVKQVINITDFGHLVSDGDEGEDKMTKGMKREKLTLTMENMRTFATKYMDAYLEDIASINVAVEKIQFPRASDHVATMIAMIQTLVEKGYAYNISDGVYFDTAKFNGYGALGGIDLEGLKEGARVEINSEKHSPQDFALWKSVGVRSKIGWQSPWGKGFPGWHLECSAMIHDLLGKQIDIHTGGIEHIAIHHNNEIAQSEASTGKKPLSRFWMHREHIRMGSAKLAKSTGNVAYLSDVVDHKIHPLALRYWFLTAHYRQAANFSWEALEASQKAYLRLREKFDSLSEITPVALPASVLERFSERLADDLDTPGAIAVLWETINQNEILASQVKEFLNTADRVFGLGLTNKDALLEELLSSGKEVPLESLPQDIQDMYRDRQLARENKDWMKSDELRKTLEEGGYLLEDKPQGTKILRK